MTASVRPTLWPCPYNRTHASNHRSQRPAQTLRADPGIGRDVLHRQAGTGHRLRRAQRRGQIHHDAGDPRPGRGRRGQRTGRRAAVQEPARPDASHRGAAGRRRAAAEPQRPQPPAVARALPGADRKAGRRGDRAGRADLGGPAQGGRLLTGYAPAAGDRLRAARRSTGAHAGRAGQRPRSRGHRVDPRLPALAGRRRTRRADLQPPDERAAGCRRPSRGGRPRPGHHRHRCGRPDRRRLRRPGHAAHDGTRARDVGADPRRRHRDRHRTRHAHRLGAAG